MGFEPAGHCGKFMITSARAAPPTKVVSRRQGDDVAGPVELCGERHGRVVQLHREGQEAAVGSALDYLMARSTRMAVTMG